MMKKLFALALVLSVASLANAGFSIVANGTSFDLMSSQADMGDFYMIIDAQYGDVEYANVIGGNSSSATDYDALFGGPFNPTQLGVMGLPTESAYIWSFNVADTTAPLAAGKWGTFTSVAGTEWATDGVAAGWLIDKNTLGVLGTISVVPEPATMALLGLGALVLRRKK